MLAGFHFPSSIPESGSTPAAQPACGTPGSALLGPGELCTFPLCDGQSGRQLFQSLIDGGHYKKHPFPNLDCQELYWVN